MKKTKPTLPALFVWQKIGVQSSTARTVCRIIASPVFLIVTAIAAAVLAVRCDPRLWVIALVSAVFAVASIIIHRWASRRINTLVSKKQIQKFNQFRTSATILLPLQLFNRIDFNTPRTSDDEFWSICLYEHLVEETIRLDLCEKTGRSKINDLTGREFVQIKTMQIFTDFTLSRGIGYVLIKPLSSLYHKAESMFDADNIVDSLCTLGLTNWTAENISDNKTIHLYVLHDESISNSYDFCEVEE
jgi:ABC-type multidrug transport system fused ATPase/permease subunit